MPDTALPMSKAALNRLGERLMAGERITDTDLETLAGVVDVYQQVLDGVKSDLTRLGYEATTRVKTTTTLVEKLRREGRMALSRVQDLAGARIIVSDRPSQDMAAAKIRDYFQATGHSCKLVDRRKKPSHGYRALHLVVNISSVLVEIQIRTDLEDTWAQIVERLADQWGRGIRYGEDPAEPETKIRAGDEVFSRREAVANLIEMGDVIGSFEHLRGALMLLGQAGQVLGMLTGYLDEFPQAQDPRPIAELDSEERVAAGMVAAGLALTSPAESRPAIDPQAMTVGQVLELLGGALVSMAEENGEMLSQVGAQEQVLRDTLQVIASAAAERE